MNVKSVALHVEVNNYFLTRWKSVSFVKLCLKNCILFFFNELSFVYKKTKKKRKKERKGKRIAIKQGK